VGISRLPSIKTIPSLWRLPILIMIAVIISISGYKFGNWALEQYNQQKKTYKTEPKPLTADDLRREFEKLKTTQKTAIPSPEIKLVFKNSPLLTAARQKKITTELNSFRNYLIRLGFEVPKETPPMGIENKVGFTSGGTTPGDSVLDWSINIGEKDIDNLTIWRLAYTEYVFRKILSESSVTKEDRFQHNFFTIIVFDKYFTYSFRNQPVNKRMDGGRDWVPALWEIRDRCGHDFTDQALFYTFRSILRHKTTEDESDFNKYFLNQFISGLWVVDNDLHSRSKIFQIFKKYNLFKE